MKLCFRVVYDVHHCFFRRHSHKYFLGPVQKFNFQQYIKWLADGQPIPQDFTLVAKGSLVFKDALLENVSGKRFMIPDAAEKFQKLDLHERENQGAWYRMERAQMGESDPHGTSDIFTYT